MSYLFTALVFTLFGYWCWVLPSRSSNLEVEDRLDKWIDETESTLLNEEAEIEDQVEAQAEETASEVVDMEVDEQVDEMIALLGMKGDDNA